MTKKTASKSKSSPKKAGASAVKKERAGKKGGSDGVPAKQLSSKSSPTKAKSSPVKKPAGKKGSSDGIPAKQLILKIAADSYCREEESITKEKVIQLSKLAKKTVMNNMGKLKKDGLIDYPKPGTICLTEAGVKHMGDECKILTPEEKRAKVMENLKGKNLRVYELLKDGSTMSKDELAKKLDYADGKKQKGFQNLIGKLKGEGMVEYPEKDQVKLADAWII